ncbi:MAG: hypothetical protein ACFFCS_01905 [Candidatus Hodarchaeota archaeon]
MTVVQSRPRFTINNLCKYPFLNSAKEWIKDKDISPIDAFYKHVRILDRIRELLTDALENKENTTALHFDDTEILYLYPLLRILLSFINTPRVTYKIANLLSKHFGNLLSKEDEITLLQVSRDQGINVEPLLNADSLVIGSVSFEYRIHFLNFLRVATKFKSPSWKLVNRLLKDGNVFLRKQDLARILEEEIKNKAIDIPKADEVQDLKEKFMEDPLLKPFFDDLMNIIKKKIKQSDVYDKDYPVNESAFPPCINAILDKNANGINLTHSERLFLTSFLLTIGRSVDEVLGLFNTQPDFKEDIARYQVEHIAGMHGKGTVYTPHNCNTLDSYGICMKHDDKYSHPNCVEPKFPFKNPLIFYKRELKTIAYYNMIEKENEEKQQEKEKKEE